MIETETIALVAGVTGFSSWVWDCSILFESFLMELAKAEFHQPHSRKVLALPPSFYHLSNCTKNFPTLRSGHTILRIGILVHTALCCLE